MRIRENTNYETRKLGHKLKIGLGDKFNINTCADIFSQYWNPSGSERDDEEVVSRGIIHKIESLDLLEERIKINWLFLMLGLPNSS